MHQRKIEVAASVLNADFSKWQEWLPQLEKAKVERIQFDIMDGKYVPNTGINKKTIAELRPHTKLFFESHLMVEKPEGYVKEFAENGTGLLLFHVETTKKPIELIGSIQASGMKAGIAVNNRTPAEKIFPYLEKVDLALVMSVEAGSGGQKFNPAALEKIKALRQEIEMGGFGCKIEVDGGINAETAGQCVAAGADVLVAGTFLFIHPKVIFEAVKGLRKA
ncbi:Ribulose-phosphate 3 epimerase family protein [uncultured archaeon]|nr:Ribulose-phosphate 3 epimerase family protein [uncultured archaeon]